VSLRLLLCVSLAAFGAHAATVDIPSSLDGKPQPALVDLPADATKPVPLIVHLHSWSSRFDSSNNFDEIRAEARQRGWALISPDFRGVNSHPAACGSELAVQDVLDAVTYMKAHARIDERRIYLAGSSGGGYMALLVAARAPHVWAAVSAWVPITDLAAWHEFSAQKKARYAPMMEACFGHPPTHGHAAQQYRRRSPLFALPLAQGLPVDIQTGIRDGHDGSVPVSHSLLAFNALAAPADRIPTKVIESITRDARVPAAFASTSNEQRLKPVLLRRQSGAARVTIFDGAHEADFPAAVRWLETHRQAEAAIVTTLQHHQLLPRDASGFAQLPAPTVRGGHALQVRVNNGPWQATLPRLATGGPYTVDFRAGPATLRRTDILVGDIYLLAGQSNMVGRAPLLSNGANPAAPDPRIRVYTPEDTWAIARDPLHEAIPRDGRTVGIGLGLPFAKAMLQRTGVPVALVPSAVGGTSLDQWNPALRATGFRRSLYGNFLARAQAAGRAKAILWYQGEADALQLATAETYGPRFQSLVKQMRADLDHAALPFYYAQLARYVVPPSEAPGWDLVRESQRTLEASLAPGGMVATLDLPLADPIHLDRLALERLGRRFAARILDGPAPALVSLQWEDRQRLRLKFTHRLQAPARIHGFDFGEPAAFHASQDAATGDIILLIGATVKSRDLYYGRGLNPVCDLVDARGQALPAFGPLAVPERPAE